MTRKIIDLWGSHLCSQTATFFMLYRTKGLIKVIVIVKLIIIDDDEEEEKDDQ